MFCDIFLKSDGVTNAGSDICKQDCQPQLAPGLVLFVADSPTSQQSAEAGNSTARKERTVLEQQPVKVRQLAGKKTRPYKPTHQKDT